MKLAIVYKKISSHFHSLFPSLPQPAFIIFGDFKLKRHVLNKDVKFISLLTILSSDSTISLYTLRRSWV